MATVPVEVPNELVAETVLAVAQRLGVAAPTTDAERLKMTQDFLTEHLAVALIDYRSQRASEFARSNPADPVVAWLDAIRAARGNRSPSPAQAERVT